MMGQHRGDNARAALAAMVAATGGSEAGRRLCAVLLDRAEDLIVNGPADLVAAAGGSPDPVDRLAAAILLSRLCANCRFCERGVALSRQGLDDDDGEAVPAPLKPPPMLGPIGAAKWRSTRG